MLVLKLLAGLSFALGMARAHVHVQVGYSAGRWDLHVLDFDSGRFAPEQYPLFVAPAARQAVPAGDSFRFLGPAGDAVWILPQNEASGLLNLGIGTSGIGPGVFVGNQLRLSLARVDGPGHFAMFSLSPLGVPVVHLASADGVHPDADVLTLPAVNGHMHVNWSFSAPGVYRVGFVVHGMFAATGLPAASPVTDYTFIVQGPPAPRLSAPRPRSDGTWELQVTAPGGELVRVETSDGLGPWAPLLELTGTGEPVSFDLPAPGNARQFVRAVIP
ncbi:MAG: choice-of-anchor M domain-containing protein [Verrucomicrobiae bacterium]|nr:choice-of-anchor M domain-containing protein [Verrucomicrobiae bacterium]